MVTRGLWWVEEKCLIKARNKRRRRIRWLRTSDGDSRTPHHVFLSNSSWHEKNVTYCGFFVIMEVCGDTCVCGKQVCSRYRDIERSFFYKSAPWNYSLDHMDTWKQMTCDSVGEGNLNAVLMVQERWRVVIGYITLNKNLTENHIEEKNKQ